MDWTGCELVEVIPGKVSGRPVIEGTRILAGMVGRYYACGSSIEEIREDCSSLSGETVQRMIGYLKTRHASAA